MQIMIPILVLAAAVYSQAIELANSAFNITIDNDTGALSSIMHPGDPAGMSWIGSPVGNTPWLPRSTAWGLGFADLGGESMHRTFWSKPTSIEQAHQTSVTVTYELFNLVRITAVRTLHDTAAANGTSSSLPIFTERYTFTNLSPDTPLDLQTSGLSSLAIYTPVNDHYTNTTDVTDHRAHAHLWPRGGASSWIKNTRMGGHGPHLGLVLTEGNLAGYSVEARDTVTSSDTRGAMSVHPKMKELGIGEETSVGWTLFWHDDWDDFFEKAGEASGQFVEFEVLSGGQEELEENKGLFSVLQGEEVRVRVKGKRLGDVGDLTLDGVAMSKVATKTTTNNSSSWSTYEVSLGSDLQVGEHRLELKTSNDGLPSSYAFITVLPSVDDLISKRIRFITEKQQVPDSGNNTLSGAYVVYDTQMQGRVTFDTYSDRNSGRERLAMGVLAASWLRFNPDAAVEQSLVRYYTFVCTQLQNETTGYVLNGPGDDDLRLYNWPWVMHLHVSMALLGDKITLPDKLNTMTPLERFMLTVESFYREGGVTYYPIGVPIMQGLHALGDAGMQEAHDRALWLFVQHGEKLKETGTNYPSSEVNYEQSIIAPAATMLLELYRYTEDKKWLEAAVPHFERLVIFGGRQPDHHLHDIAIRHWDGYWFGKDRMWGDTFPHYWSVLTGVAMHHYSEALVASDGDKELSSEYARRAEGIMRANAGTLFSSEDGSASCAYLYPDKVNGRVANYLDPYANDQDWALVYYFMLPQSKRETSY